MNTPSGNAEAPRRMGPFVWIVAVLAAVAGGLYFHLARNGLTIPIAKSALQARVDARLPVIGARGPLNYSVNSAILDLRPDGRIAVEAAIGLRVLDRAAEARVLGSGLLEYKDGDFFLRNIAIEDVALAEVQTGAKTGTGLGQILNAQLRNVVAVAMRQVEDELRKRGGAVLGAVLDSYPVYRLKQEDHKQALARLVLEKIEVRDQTLVATLNVTGKK